MRMHQFQMVPEKTGLVQRLNKALRCPVFSYIMKKR